MKKTNRLFIAAMTAIIFIASNISMTAFGQTIMDDAKSDYMYMQPPQQQSNSNSTQQQPLQGYVQNTSSPAREGLLIGYVSEMHNSPWAVPAYWLDCPSGTQVSQNQGTYDPQTGGSTFNSNQSGGFSGILTRIPGGVSFTGTVYSNPTYQTTTDFYPQWQFTVPAGLEQYQDVFQAMADDLSWMASYHPGETAALMLGVSDNPQLSGFLKSMTEDHPLELAQIAASIAIPTLVAEGSSIWDLSNAERGAMAEDALGRNLARNFPTIDAWDAETGAATSIKSLDVGAPSYQSGSALYSRLKGYIQQLADFKGANWAKINIEANEIVSRELKLAIPPTAMTSAQLQALQNAYNLAVEKGIQLTIHTLP